MSVEIRAIRFHRVALARIYNTKVAPMGGHEGGKLGSEYLVIELETTDGSVGLGEVSDIESNWGAIPWVQVHDLMNDVLVGRKLAERASLIDEVAIRLPDGLHRELRVALRAAVEAALLDATARVHGIPVYDLLGGLKRRSVLISWVAFIGNEDGIDAEIQEKADGGFKAFKLKVGADHYSDLERIKVVRRIAPDAHIRVDASGEWTPDEAIAKLDEMHALGVRAVETPIQSVARSVAKNAPETVNENVEAIAEELASVKAAVLVRVIEHVSDFDDAFSLALAQHGSVDVFNVLPGQAGGVLRAQRLIHLAEMSGIDVLLGSTVELSPGTAVALHLGAACEGVTEASDLVGPGLLVDDVCERPLAYTNGVLRVGDEAGLGVVLSERKLEVLGA